MPLPHDPIGSAFARHDRPTLKAGLDALVGERHRPARARIRDSLPDDALDRHISTWAIAIERRRDVPSGEIAAAQRDRCLAGRA